MEALAQKIQAYPGVTRKRRIGAFTNHFKSLANARIVADFGEDCAVLEVAGLPDQYLLLALDAIVPELLRRAPCFAGYSSILVNVLDVVAMAGHPIAVVDFVGSVGAAFEAQVAEGMSQACEHFQVPVVGGHLHPDDASPSLAVAILGRVRRKDCTFSHTARVGDDLLVAVDLSGERIREYPVAWSPLRQKSRREVARRFDAVRGAARAGYLRAMKDASNPGIVGTIGMMLEASGVGGTIEVDLIPCPAGVPVEDWLLMYQGCGFVMSSDPRRTGQAIKRLEAGGFSCARAGVVERPRRLDLARGAQRVTAFEFAKGGITGIAPAAA